MSMNMTRRAMLGAVPAAGFVGQAFAQQPPTGSRLGLPVETDITSTLDSWIDTYGRPTAKVMLNGQGPFQFMVDTGSTTTVLAQRHITALGAPLTGMATVAGTTGVAEAPVAELARLETGAVTRNKMRVAVLPDESLARIDGILGADVFVGKRLVFNIQDKLVRVESSRRPVRTSVRGNMRVRNGLLAELDGRVGNVAAKLMLDTGAEECIANMALSQALLKAHPRLERVDNVRVFGVTGHVIMGQYIGLPKVDMKAFSVKDASCVAADARIFDLWGLNDEPAMIVGVNLLSRLDTFSIDYAAKQFDATLLSQLIARNQAMMG